MDMFPLVKSKLITPELPLKMLYSRRMKGFHIDNKRITVITAQAGFGKTTTVLLALKEKEICWYRMEKEDSFLQVFYTHLIETLFRNKDKSGVECHRALNGVQNLEEEYPIINAQICQDAADIDQGSKPIYLVFDDFHHVAENRVIVESLRYFAVNMPDFISIVVTSRTETNILTGKLAISKETLSIFESHLRFTREESQKLISTIYKKKYTEVEMERIYELSEGWISGLYMLCHYYTSADSEPPESDEGIFKRYFREFFYQLDQSMQCILADLSILPDFSAEEIRDIFGYENAEELLTWLETSNLYIQKLPLKAVRFRFHSLFRQELTDLLLERIDKNQLHERYLKAVDYYSDRGNKVLAIKLLLCIDKTDLAAEIAETECIYNFDKGHLENISEFISGFSEDIIMQNPYLMFFKSITYQNINHETSLEYAMKALRIFSTRRDMSYLMNTFGMILVITFQTNSFEKLKEAAGWLPAERIALGGRAPLIKLLISMASGMVADEKFFSATFLYQLLDRMKIDDPVWNYSYLMIKGILLYRTGKLEKAMHNFDSVLNHPVGITSDRWKITGMVAGHLALNLMRDLDKSKAVMTELAILAEEYDSYFAQGFTYRIAAFISYQTNDMANAIKNMEKSAEAFERSISPTLASVSKITKYFWLSNGGHSERMAEQMQIELENMQDYEIGHGFYELCQTMTGAVFIKIGCFKDAEKILLSALKSSKKKNASQSICGTLTQLISLSYCTSDEERLKKYLRKWTKMVVKNNYTFFWEADSQILVRSCALACKYNYCSEYMAKVIELYHGKEASAQVMRNPETIAERPNIIIEHDQIRGHNRRRVFIKLFGRFKITADGLEITEEAFKTRKISGILKYILLNTEKAVSREILTGILWPESDEKSAFASLRVALSELRKVLAKCNMAFDGANALICENKSGFFINKDNELIFDTNEFVELYKQYRSFTDNDDRHKTDILEKMVQIYHGDLLEDNLYDDWLMVTREHYRAIFIEASYSLADVYIKQNLFEQAERILNKHLRIEPLDEKACRMLLEIFRSTDQGNRAAAFKRQFEQRFFEEIGQKAEL